MADSRPGDPAWSASAGRRLRRTEKRIADKSTAYYQQRPNDIPSSSLPPGLILFPNGSFRGTPTAAGTYHVVVTVIDSGSPAGRASANYSIVIAPPPSPTIRTKPAPSAGAINLPYSFAFTVASGGQAPFSWSETGMLPAGLVFNNDGVLSGTPTALGSSPIAVMVQDVVGQDSAPQNSSSRFTCMVSR